MSSSNSLTSLALFHTSTNSTPKNDLHLTYLAQSALHSALNHNLGHSKGNWLLPALHVVCRNTHRVAALADGTLCHTKTNGGKNDHARLQNAVTLLQMIYSKTLNDRVEVKWNQPLGEEGSKKAGVLFVVNELFSMYFKLNTLRLCKNLLAASVATAAAVVASADHAVAASAVLVVAGELGGFGAG